MELQLREKVRLLDKESSPGVSEMSNAILWVLASSDYPHNLEAAEAIKRLQRFGELYINDCLPGWFTALFMSTRQVGIDKNKKYSDGNPDIRFIGVPEAERSLFWSAALQQHGACLRKIMEPQQLAMGTKAGGQILIWGTALEVEQNLDHLFVKIDLQNMFGAFKRKAAVEAILEQNECDLFHRGLNMEAYKESNIYVQGPDGNLIKAQHKYSEGGAQGTTSALILACAAIMKPLRKLDDTLKPHGGACHYGIDDGVVHGPAEVLIKAVAQFQQDCSENGMKVNYNSTMVYHPRGCYQGIPAEYDIGNKIIKVKANDGTEEQITVEGLTIWGGAVSKDERYIKATLNEKAKEINSEIETVTTALNFLSKDCAMTAYRLSLTRRFQFYQQVHLPIHTIEAATMIQKTLDKTLIQIIGIDLQDQTSFLKDQVISQTNRLKFPTLVSETIALPTKNKGLGIRKLDNFVGLAAWVGAMNLVARSFIDVTTQTGAVIPGLYPLLEPVFGAHSQDDINADSRFEVFVDGRSNIGKELTAAWDMLRTTVPATELQGGPLEQDVQSLGTGFYKEKLQNTISRQIEESRAKVNQQQYQQLDGPLDERIKIMYENRNTETTTFLTTVPTVASSMPNNLFTSAVCLVFGAISPMLRTHEGAPVGNNQQRLDIHGDMLGAVTLPGDRWRRAHDIEKNIIHQDAQSLGVLIQQEVYGLFTPFMSPRGRTTFDNMQRSEKSNQIMVPDLVTYGHPDTSVLACVGPQMWEIKRIQAVNSFSQTGINKGPNIYYKHTSSQSKAVKRRQDKIAGEYENKAKKADLKFGQPGQHQILNGLKDMNKVKGLVVGAMGELSPNFNHLV